MKTAFVTGANRSIGLEVARQLLQRDVYVYLGCRDLKKGQEVVAQLHAEGLPRVEPIVIDLTQPATIREASDIIGAKTDALDILINNAGIHGSTDQGALTMDVAAMREVYDTNLYGTVAVTQAFYPLLKKSALPTIVMVTSGLGSITLHNDPSWRYYQVKLAAYGPSKTALNAYTTVLAYELRDTPFRVNAVDPGYTATEFNGFSGPGDIPTAAGHILEYALLGPDGPSGRFISYDNNPETGISPW